MSTSGTSVLTQSRDDIIKSAMRKCGFAAEGETPSAQMMQDAAGDLNRLMKGWQASGIKLWAYDELVLFLDLTSESYALGPTGANCVRAADLISTVSTTDAVVSDTSIVLDSVSGITSGMNIGVLQDDGTLLWGIVSGAPVGNTVTFTVALTAQASAGAAVWIYQKKVDRPLRIEQARIQTNATSEIEMTPLGREDYFRLPNKQAKGQPIQWYYSPNLINGIFYSWPVAETSAYFINLTSYRPLQIFTTGTDSADMPDETSQALIWNLADEIGPEYGIDAQTMAKIEKKAAMWLATVEGFDVEDASVIFMPDMRS